MTGCIPATNLANDMNPTHYIDVFLIFQDPVYWFSHISYLGTSPVSFDLP